MGQFGKKLNKLLEDHKGEEIEITIGIKGSDDKMNAIVRADYVKEVLNEHQINIVNEVSGGLMIEWANRHEAGEAPGEIEVED